MLKLTHFKVGGSSERASCKMFVKHENSITLKLFLIVLKTLLESCLKNHRQTTLLGGSLSQQGRMLMEPEEASVGRSSGFCCWELQ